MMHTSFSPAQKYVPLVSILLPAERCPAGEGLLGGFCSPAALFLCCGTRCQRACASRARWQRATALGPLQCELGAEIKPRLCPGVCCRSRVRLQVHGLEQLPKPRRFQGQPDMGLDVCMPNFNTALA